jgi:hypothetical protein
MDANSNTGLQHWALFFVFIIGVTSYMVSRESLKETMVET